MTLALLIQEGVVPAFFSLGCGKAALEAHVFAQNKSYYGDASTYIDGMLNQLNLSAEVFQTFVLKANPRAIAKMKPPRQRGRVRLDAQVVQIPMCSGTRAACEGNCVLSGLFGCLGTAFVFVSCTISGAAPGSGHLFGLNFQR